MKLTKNVRPKKDKNSNQGKMLLKAQRQYWLQVDILNALQHYIIPKTGPRIQRALDV